MNALFVTEDVFQDQSSDGHSCLLLLSAVLERAVTDVLLYKDSDGKSKELFVNAYRWLFQDDRTIYNKKGMTFLAVCDLLSLDSVDVRKQVRDKLQQCEE